MANAKGSIFLNVKEYVIQEHGEESWHKLLRLLTPKERETIGLQVQINDWYPMPLLKRLIGAYDNLLGSGEFKTIVPIALHIANKDIIPVLEKFVNMQNISMILRNTPSLWKRYFDAGNIKVVEANDADGLYKFSLVEFDDLSGQVFCVYLISTWLKYLLEKSGVKQINIKFIESNLDAYNSSGTLEVSWSVASH